MTIESDEELKKRLSMSFYDDGVTETIISVLEGNREKFAEFPQFDSNHSFKTIIADMRSNRNIKHLYSKNDAFEKKYKYSPKAIDFYYLRIDTDSKIRVDHYPYTHKNEENISIEIPKNDLIGIIGSLAKNARDSGNNPKKGLYNNFNNIKWKSKSYIVFFLEEKDWEFLSYDPTNKVGGLLFKKISSHTGNPCFFNTEILSVPMPPAAPVDNRQALVCINHMKDDSGKDLGNVDVEYKFDIVLRAPFANPSSDKLTIIIDPTGTNDGPPVEP